MKSLRNAPSVWLDKAGLPLVLDQEAKPAGWVPLVAASQATIEILETDPQWEQSYQAWLSGKNPSLDPRWKAGVFMAWM